MEKVYQGDSSEKPVQYAGFWLRFGAHLIDDFILAFFSFLIIGPIIFFTGLTAGLSSFIGLSMDDISDEEKLMMVGGFISYIFIIAFISIVINWLYYAVMESSSRQATVGKLALDIKVTDMEGKRITFLNATGRYFAKIISGMTLTIGYLMAGFTEKKQALHDILASCLVVKN